MMDRNKKVNLVVLCVMILASLVSLVTTVMILDKFKDSYNIEKIKE